MEVKDYRPVSITNFIEKKLIYHHYQSGYRKNHAIAALLAKLRDGIKEAMKASEMTLAVLTDYSKAFDTIDFSVLIRKMLTLNVFYIGFLSI